jgi:hypothetical protein
VNEPPYPEGDNIDSEIEEKDVGPRGDAPWAFAVIVVCVVMIVIRRMYA